MSDNSLTLASMSESPDHSDHADNDRGKSVATEPPRTPSPPARPHTAAFFRMPISNKASTTIILTLSYSLTDQAHKDRNYDKKITSEMDEITVEVTYDKFMEIASGTCKQTLSADNLKTIGDFSQLHDKSVRIKWEMYPIFVSDDHRRVAMVQN